MKKKLKQDSPSNLCDITGVVCITQKAMAVLFLLWWRSNLMKYVDENVGDIFPEAHCGEFVVLMPLALSFVMAETVS